MSDKKNVNELVNSNLEDLKKQAILNIVQKNPELSVADFLALEDQDQLDAFQKLTIEQIQSLGKVRKKREKGTTKSSKKKAPKAAAAKESTEPLSEKDIDKIIKDALKTAGLGPEEDGRGISRSQLFEMVEEFGITKSQMNDHVHYLAALGQVVVSGKTRSQRFAGGTASICNKAKEVAEANQIEVLDFELPEEEDEE